MVVKAMRDFKHGDVTHQLDFDALLQSAIAHQQAGSLSNAASIYQQILQQQPDNFNALYLAGVVAWRQGNSDEAINKFNRTIALKRDHAEAHKKLGDIFKQQSRTEERSLVIKRRSPTNQLIMMLFLVWVFCLAGKTISLKQLFIINKQLRLPHNMLKCMGKF
ncbi:MAG: tetratricopeptide repeat protein [Pseudanabaena sp. RU_4_16]|nr:tetratricopeptide repeat protein [Pseudanabaena sp. RU_4_16]